MQKYTLALISISTLLWSALGLGCDELLIALYSEDRKSLATNRLEWWYTGQEKNKKLLACDKGVCNEWRLPTSRNRNISVELVAVRNHENDEDCSDLFRGTVEVDEQNGTQAVEVQFTETVCK